MNLKRSTVDTPLLPRRLLPPDPLGKPSGGVEGRAAKRPLVASQSQASRGRRSEARARPPRPRAGPGGIGMQMRRSACSWQGGGLVYGTSAGSHAPGGRSCQGGFPLGGRRARSQAAAEVEAGAGGVCGVRRVACCSRGLARQQQARVLIRGRAARRPAQWCRDSAPSGWPAQKRRGKGERGKRGGEALRQRGLRSDGGIRSAASASIARFCVCPLGGASAPRETGGRVDVPR